MKNTGVIIWRILVFLGIANKLVEMENKRLAKMPDENGDIVQLKIKKGG